VFLKGAPFLTAWSTTARWLIVAAVSWWFSPIGQGAEATLTHRYSFNGLDAADSVGTVNGVLVNGASVSDGKLVLDNDGVNSSPATGQYVNLPENILKTRNFTLETWFTYDGGNPWQRILDISTSAASSTAPGDKGFIILAINSSDHLLAQFFNTTKDLNNGGYSSTPYPETGEHHIVYTHSFDTGQVQLFFDGARIASSTWLPAGRADMTTMNFGNFWIGRSLFPSDPFLNGSISELRTYDQALTAEQVLADYQAGPDLLPVPEPATVALVLVAGAGFLLMRRSRVQP
jgi:hypothetical protein